MRSSRTFCFCICLALAFLFIRCDDASAPEAGADPFKWTSGVTTISTDSQTVENLIILGRVWGFLKYYHPNVASGKYKWDYELFKIMPKIISSKTIAERNTLLSTWIDSLGTFELQDSVQTIDSSRVRLWPDYSWINDASLEKVLTEQLSRIRIARRDARNYYVGLGPALNPVFENEPLYDSLQFPDAGYRILCLFRYWNMIEYFYPYKHLVDEPWGNILKGYLPKFINCKDELDYELCAIRMTAEIHDSHASTYGDINAFVDSRGNYNPSVRLSFIEGKAVVVGFGNSKAEVSSGLKRGDVILSVDDVTIDTLYNQRKKNLRASNEATARRNFCTGILTSKDSLIQVCFERNGSVQTIDVLCDDQYSTSDLLPVYGIDTAICMVRPDIAYIFPGLVTASALSTFLKQIPDAKGIIIDFRCYPKETIIDTLSNFLFPYPTPIAKYTHTSPITPGLFTYTENELQGRANLNYYKGKVVVIVNENTQSSSEYHAMAIQQAPLAIVLGSTTAGADGNVSEIFLPGGIKTMFSGIGVAYPDGRETQRVGIIPDIEVHPTIKGIREGRDEVMEAAIAYINR